MLQIVLLVSALSTFLFATVDRYLHSYPAFEPEGLVYSTAVIGALLFLLFYTLSRIGYLRSAASAAAVTALVLAFAGIVLSEDGKSHAVFMLVVPVVGSLVMGRRMQFGLAVASVGAAALSTFARPDFTPHERYYLICAAGLIAAATVVMTERRQRASQSTQTAVGLRYLGHLPVYGWSMDYNQRLCEVFGTTSASTKAAVEQLLRDTAFLKQCKSGQNAGEEWSWHHTVDGRAYHSYVLPVPQEIEAPPLSIGITVDVTELESRWEKEIQGKIEAQQAQVLSEFLRSSAHDLRTPLSILNTTLYLIERAPDDTRRSERIEVLKETVDRLERVIENMFTMMRIDALPHYDARVFDLREVLAEVVQANVRAAADKGIAFALDIGTPLPQICGHRSELSRALAQLVDNALQYTDTGGCVTVTARQDAGVVRVDVLDTGSEVDTSDLPFIFDRFYRAEKHRHLDDHAHTGIGLALAKKIVEKHGGRIEVSSEVNRGSRFTILLPLNASSDCEKWLPLAIP